MAQNPVAGPTSILGFDQPAPDLVSAQGYTYKYYPDSSSTAAALTGVTCAGTASPFQCQSAFPTFAQGNHTLTISATNVAGESPKSDPFAFAFVSSPPQKPSNIHIK